MFVRPRGTRFRARLSCAAALGLSRGNRLRMPLVGNVQRSVLLDMAGLQCDFCDVEAWILRDLNRIKLGGVESPRDSLQRTRQSSLGRLFRRQPQASSRAALHPHKVPARLADHCIENRRRDLFHKRPVVAEVLPERIQTIRKDAPLAQENRMRLHACALLDTVGA